MKKLLLFGVCLIITIALTLSLSVTAFASDEAIETTETDTDGNGFSEAFNLVAENSDKIFSILAFVSSIAVALAYKKGLIPIINQGLSAMKKSADNFEAGAGESLIKAEKAIGFLTDRFVSCENTVDSISASLSQLSERLLNIENEKDERETFKTVMLSQIDMLYDIFMQSGLPQYSKDALGEKVAKMKKSLSLGENND